MMMGKKIKIKRDVMVRIDSLLSCLLHRHKSTMERINELTEVRELAAIVRDITEPRK